MKKTDSVRSNLVWIVVFCAALVFGALAFYATNSGRTIPAAEQRLANQKKRVDVPKASYDGDRLVLETRPKDVPEKADPIVFSVNAFLEGTQITAPEARAVSSEVQGRLLKLHFSPEFNQTYGTEDEQTLLKGIIATLGQFTEIDAVQFMIGDKPLETLGNVDLTEPQPIEH